MARSRITAIEEVPENDTLLFIIEERNTGEEAEAILLRAGDEIACWLNYCQHLTHIRLDKGSGAPTRNGEIVCANHGATFERDSGLCTYGPCEGAYLNGVEVAVENGDVYLEDPDYEFVTTGPIERDPIDLSSTSNVEF
jgi:nitrite reductase/ring-hydroxylating ferredoxin subunit